MRIAILAESGVDDAVLRVIVSRLVPGAEFQAVRTRRAARGVGDLVARGWRLLLAAALHIGAEGILIVADSDHTTPHTESQEPWQDVAVIEPCNVECRLCILRSAWLKARSTTAAIRNVAVAVGVAIPSIEAWLLADQKGVSEAPYLAQSEPQWHMWKQ